MATSLFEPGADDVVYLVDLSSYLLRAYHAVAPLSSPMGEPTHAVHGTVTMLERLFRERRPRLVAIAMDAGRVTFRKDIYPEYKAHRPPAPDDLRSQIDRSEQIVRSMGLAVFKQPGVEADDLIATIVKQATSRGMRVVIVGADKDLMQLVTERVLLWDTLRNKVFGPPEVRERFGVDPARLGDLLALMGDSSDNIPGVPSVGPKTAAELLETFGDLDGIFARHGEITRKKLRETLVEHEANARLSRRLVTLKDDCELDASRQALSFGHGSEKNLAELERVYRELGFSRQLAQLAKVLESEPSTGQTTNSAPGRVEAPETALSASAAPMARGIEAPAFVHPSNVVVSDPEALDALTTALARGTWAIEPYFPRPDGRRERPVGIGLRSSGTSWYLPLGHRYLGAPNQLGTEALDAIGAALRGGTATVVLHDEKRLRVALPNLLGVSQSTFDVHLGLYLLDPERAHTIESIAERFGRAAPSFESVLREGKRRLTFDEIAVEDAAKFAGARTEVLLEVEPHLREQLGEAGLGSLLETLETPIARLLAEMELRGVLIDVTRLGSLGATSQQELERLELEAHRIAGKEFNVASPRQLETILFDELGLKPHKRTKTSRSTDAETLEALAEEHPLPMVVLEHRKIAKLKGTYIDALPALVDPATGRVHCSWEQAVAATGRISSTDPNLQNIPIRSELGRAIRAAFVAPPGHLLVSADYSQIELRVLAHLSNDEKLLEAFRLGQDIHTRTAMEIFGVDEEGVTKEMRARAKAVNFGVIYGQGESGLSRSLGIERSVAASFITTYFERYRGVKSFMERTLDAARQGEAVQSVLGRRRIVPDIKSGNRARRLAAERIAMNMPIQGSAADILKLAMLRLCAPVTPGSRMVLTVHDELVFEVPLEEVDAAVAKIEAEMSAAYQLSVPLVVTAKRGATWNEAH